MDFSEIIGEFLLETSCGMNGCAYNARHAIDFLCNNCCMARHVFMCSDHYTKTLTGTCWTIDGHEDYCDRNNNTYVKIAHVEDLINASEDSPPPSPA